MTSSGPPEILVLTSRCSGRLETTEPDLEPFPTRIEVQAGTGGDLEVALVGPSVSQPGSGDRDSLTLDLAADLPELASLPQLEALLESWVPLLAAGERPLPPPRPLLVILPFGAFPAAARRFRAWAVRRLRRPLLLVSEPLAVLASHLEVLVDEAPAQGAVPRIAWLAAGEKDPRHLEVELSRGSTPRAVVVGFRPLPAGHSSVPCPPGGPALVRGAARLARWLLGESAGTQLRLGLRPLLQVCEPHLRAPLVTWPLDRLQGPFMRSLELQALGNGPAPVEVRAWLGPGRGESSVLAALSVPGACRMEVQALRGSGEVRLFPRRGLSSLARARLELPELVS